MTKTSKPAAKAKTKTGPKNIIEFATFYTPGLLPVPIILKPEDGAWSDTINKLADLQVDQWDANYCNPFIMDGSSWYLTVRSTELKIKSSGSNAYPPNFDAVREVIENTIAVAPVPTQRGKPKSSYIRKPRKCPSCGSATVASILYGDPIFSEDIFEKVQRGEVIFGGCVTEIDGSQPSWQCPKCDAQFFKKA